MRNIHRERINNSLLSCMLESTLVSCEQGLNLANGEGIKATLNRGDNSSIVFWKTFKNHIEMFLMCDWRANGNKRINNGLDMETILRNRPSIFNNVPSLQTELAAGNSGLQVEIGVNLIPYLI